MSSHASPARSGSGCPVSAARMRSAASGSPWSSSLRPSSSRRAGSSAIAADYAVTSERPPRTWHLGGRPDAPGRGVSRRAAGSINGVELLGAVQKLQDVVVAEPAIAALADPEERELATVAKALDGVHVQVQHLGDLGRREQLPDLVRHHGLRSVLVVWALTRAVRTGRCGRSGSWSDSKVAVPSGRPVRSGHPGEYFRRCLLALSHPTCDACSTREPRLATQATGLAPMRSARSSTTS